MFERFTQSARATVVYATEEAHGLGHDFVGTEHLLLGLLRQPAETGPDVLVRHGLDLVTARVAVRRLLDERGEDGGRSLIDGTALEAIGIDLDAVTERVEATFGAGALSRPSAGGGSGRGGPRSGRLRFTGRAKKVMELSVRAARGREDDHLGTGHLLLGLLREGGGLAVVVLRDHGLDLAELERSVEAAQL